MSFNFIQGGDDYPGLQHLIKTNGGLFKSEKQAKFWVGRIKKTIERKIEDAKWHRERLPDPWEISFQGQNIPRGAVLIKAQAALYYGRRHNRIDYTFIVDGAGILAKFKSTNMRNAEEEFKVDREVVSIEETIKQEAIKHAEAQAKKVEDLAEAGIVIPLEVRSELEGDIVMIKREASVWPASPHDPYSNRHTMKIQCNGFTTKGTVPKAFHTLAAKHGIEVKDFLNAPIKFTAKLHASKHDVQETYFSRPSKFEVDDDFIALALLQRDF